MKLEMMALAAMSALTVGAQGQDAFARQQAYAEMQRVTGQMDVLQANFNDLQARVGKLEGGGDSQSLRAEIEALKASLAEIRRELQAQRGEIVKDLAGRISKIQTASAATSGASEPKPAYKGATAEYTVQKGDTLSLIAQAFGTTVRQIKEMNNLKGDGLRIDQVLVVPKK